MFPLFEKIKELAEKRGLSINRLEEHLGYSRNSLYNLKTKKPSAERLQEIADYFQVSTDYLLGRTDNPAIAKDNDHAAPSKAEEQALVLFRKETSGMSDADIAKFNIALKGLMASARALIEDDSNWNN